MAGSFLISRMRLRLTTDPKPAGVSQVLHKRCLTIARKSLEFLSPRIFFLSFIYRERFGGCMDEGKTGFARLDCVAVFHLGIGQALGTK